MPAPLRVVRTRPDSHPLVTRLSRYVALTEPEVADLLAAFERRLSMKKARDVILEGYESHKLHVAVSGFAARYKLLANGKRQIISIVLPGDIIGMPSIFFKSPRYSVSTISDMTVDVIGLQKFLNICRKTPSLAIGMLWYSEEELANYADRIVDLGRRSPLERVAHFVLELHARLHSTGRATERSFDMPVSQEIIGDLLGLSAPHVNRMLHQLKAERLISTDRRRVTLEDRQGLQLLAQFEPLSPLGERRTVGQ
jgi:CRP-like cAMP-binding protein